MNNLNYYPIVEVGHGEDAQPGTFGGAVPIPYLPEVKNYVTGMGADLERQLKDLWWILWWTRADRRALHEEWENIRSMAQMKHDAGRRYFGRSDSYLPLYRKNRKSKVSMLSRGIFPSNEWFDVVDRETQDPTRAEPVKNYHQWDLNVNAKIKQFIKPMLYQLVDYGTSPLKIWYKKDLVSRGGRILTPYGAKAEGFQQYKCEGGAVSARNLLYWYVYPSTAERLDDAEIVFEDIDLPQKYLEYMVSCGRWDRENGEKAIAAWYRDPQHDTDLDLLLQVRFQSQRPGKELPPIGRIFTITEVWCYLVLPRSAYLDYEEPDCPIPCRVVFAGNVPLEVTRNPFFHQKPPYACARLDWEPGGFYGNADGKTNRPLQLLANDFANQTNDNGIYAMNPIAIVNPQMMVGPPRALAPGVTWYAQDVEKAVKFDRPPWEQTQWGMQMLNTIMGMAQDASGTPPVLQGTKGDKTATTTSILQRNANEPIQDDVEDIEQDVMLPVLEQNHSNAVQYREEGVTVPGQTQPITPEDLDIEAHFELLASSQASNNQVRNQQALQLMQAIAPLVPLLTQQGFIVNFEALVRRIFSGMGFRGYNEFIQKAQAAPGAQMGQPAPAETLGGVQAEQQDNLRSALEQVHGAGSVEPQPGEADDFSDVRDQTDDLAGMIGSLGGVGGGGMP